MTPGGGSSLPSKPWGIPRPRLGGHLAPHKHPPVPPGWVSGSPREAANLEESPFFPSPAARGPFLDGWRSHFAQGFCPLTCGHSVSGLVAQDSVALCEQPVLKNHPRTEGFLGASHPSLWFTCFQTDHLRTISKWDNNHPAGATAQSRAEIRSQAMR